MALSFSMKVPCGMSRVHGKKTTDQTKVVRSTLDAALHAFQTKPEGRSSLSCGDGVSIAWAQVRLAARGKLAKSESL